MLSVPPLAPPCRIRTDCAQHQFSCYLPPSAPTPSLPPTRQIQERDGRVIDKGPHYTPDPLGNRTGNAPPPGLVEVLLRTAADGVEACSRNLAARGVALTVRGLQEKVDNVRGAVTMAWPMGLPEWDPVRLLIEAPEDAPDGYLAEVMGADHMDPATATLWLAGKEFFRDATVGARVGKNEKTKVIAKLQRAGGGAPAREPAVSEDERKAMMSWYLAKQAEQKALVEDNEEGYLNAKWADPRALKSALLGTGEVGWRAGGGGGRR